MTQDELKRARQSLQQEREALQAARESLASERLRLDADRRYAESQSTGNFTFNTQCHELRSSVQGSERSFQLDPTSRAYDTNINEKPLKNHFEFHETKSYVEGSEASYQTDLASGMYNLGLGEQKTDLASGMSSMTLSEQPSTTQSSHDESSAEKSIPSMHSSISNLQENQSPDLWHQKLIQYNRAWESLDKRSASIPFPTMFGTASDLANPAYIYSPHTSYPGSWTLDRLMQANAEAFFQRAMGIRPLYAESRGVLRTLDGLPTATDKQLHELGEYLKKERNRWHPDKLLLRGGGPGSPASNALLTSTATRAVLLAVNDMLDACRAEIARRMRIYESL